ncbi:uncharacterized protein [Oscarella lobularis]|uniref:uncharacterized protein isoform X2 n=1 Tax=Oscarella lobularis TaxID=121494 RepID=UPI0033132521
MLVKFVTRMTCQTSPDKRMDSGSDLPLSIPVKPIIDCFTCPVCVSLVENAHITPCGHKFCEKCIKECINRRHKCPCCNSPVLAEQLIKDHQFDELLGVVMKEREKAEKVYFDNLFEKATSDALSSPDDSKTTDDSVLNLTSMENILRKHLRKSLTVYREYLLKFQTECCRKMDYLSHKNRAAADLDKDVEEKMKLLQERFESCSAMLADSYDKYLGENLKPPSLVPLQVSMTIASKDISMANVQVKPSDSTKELREILQLALESRGEKVVSVDNADFVLIGPLAKAAGVVIPEWNSEIANEMKDHEDVVFLEAGCYPLLQYKMRPGSELCVVGEVVMESDLPKQCFVVSFRKNTDQTMDYYKCRTCGINWICKNCSLVCHKDHLVSPYMAEHVPTWACCYCSKKKLVRKEAGCLQVRGILIDQLGFLGSLDFLFFDSY